MGCRPGVPWGFARFVGFSFAMPTRPFFAKATKGGPYFAEASKGRLSAFPGWGRLGGLLGGAGAGGVEDLVEAVEEFGGFFGVLLGEVCFFRGVFG